MANTVPVKTTILSTNANSIKNGMVEEWVNAGLLSITIDNVLPINPNIMNTVNKQICRDGKEMIFNYMFCSVFNCY